jgi:Methyltransferase domain
MPHWLIKTALQHAIAALPQRQKWNYLFQRHVTKSLTLGTGMFERYLEHIRMNVGNLCEFQPNAPAGFTAVDLGTGWYPVLAVGAYLCGARKVWTIDIDPLLRRVQMKRMFELFLNYADRGELQRQLPRLKPERVAALRSAAEHVQSMAPAEILAQLNIEVLVRDAQNTGLPDNSVDLFFSTGVLEYIPEPVLRGIFTEFRRVASATAAMSHWISTIDQFHYFDKRLTPFNYLKYTSKQWRYLNSPLTWQSRLRICDYRRLMNESGFRVVKEIVENGKEKDLDSIKTAPEFERYTREELLQVTAWVVAVPEAARIQAQAQQRGRTPEGG